MNIDPEELRLAAATRQRIIDVLAGVKDASSFLRNDPSPNWLTEGRLRDLLEDHEAGLLCLGALRITAHGDCGHPDHDKKAIWPLGGSTGCWRYVLDDGRSDAELARAGEFVVDGIVMDSDFGDMLSEQGTARVPCPCAPGGPLADHTVSRYFAWPRREGSRLGELAEISLMLRDAVQSTRERKTRSGIRERLLRTLIQLERMIVPETAEDIIARCNCTYEMRDRVNS
ncbi:hypothetical protein NHN26_15985 [Rhodovulum tesquicola]|uniref:hypothetical protein n=1 Tax=Rhodovulum tesquicola TaxID=540254 RepID=UPI0020974405|nr:hypothetical protein [Rhodovulum tesquicola]MCO8146712.1 hypothetical protein [Rhodovulum tesquicola]